MMRTKQTNKNGSRILNFVKRHKIWTVIGVLVLVAGVLTAIDYYHIYQAYRERLTDKDYAAIEAMAEDVIRSAGGARHPKTKGADT